MANLFFFSTRKYWYLGVNEAKVERNVIVTRWQFFWFEFAKKKKKGERKKKRLFRSGELEMEASTRFKI